jgi:hypothetical protein
MWRDYATPAANSVRAKNPPPEPDRDGLFDVGGVVEIAARRQCLVVKTSDLQLTVSTDPLQKGAAAFDVPLTAIAPGKWGPVSILKASSKAYGRESFDIDRNAAKPTNPDGLDEIKIASVVGADGLRPYLSRRGRHGYTKDGEVHEPANVDAEIRAIRHCGRWIPDAPKRAKCGMPTWALLQILRAHEISTLNYSCRRALRALQDVGLIDIKLGP